MDMPFWLKLRPTVNWTTVSVLKIVYSDSLMTRHTGALVEILPLRWKYTRTGAPVEILETSKDNNAPDPSQPLR